MDCEPGPDGGPINFGPFPIGEGFTEIPIDIPVVAGPPRVCVAQVTATITFADGMQVSQTADQQICLLPAGTTEGVDPALNVELIGTAPSSISCGPAGDEQLFCFLVSNNSDAIFDGTFQVAMRNVADMPEVQSGQNDTSVGVFALSDPGGGDSYPLAMGDDGCITLPADPHNSMTEPFTGSVVLLPGEETEIKIKGRTWQLCANGSCGEATFEVAGFLGGEAVTACAGFVMATDNSKTPAFACPNSGRAVATAFPGTTPNGPAVVLIATPDVEGQLFIPFQFGLDVTTMQLLVNGQPISGGTPKFSGVTQVDGGYIRNVAEFSFIEPPPSTDDCITMITDFQLIVDSAPPMSFAFDALQFMDGAPNWFADMSPFMKGSIYTDFTSLGVDPFFLDFMHQISAVGVMEGTFEQVPMMNVDRQVEILNPTRYRVRSDWKAPIEGVVTLIGFDVQNDFRGFARSALSIPADFNGDGLVNGADLAVLLANWGPCPPAPDPCPANLNDDEFINGADLAALLSNWTPAG